MNTFLFCSFFERFWFHDSFDPAVAWCFLLHQRFVRCRRIVTTDPNCFHILSRCFPILFIAIRQFWFHSWRRVGVDESKRDWYNFDWFQLYKCACEWSWNSWCRTLNPAGSRLMSQDLEIKSMRCELPLLFFPPIFSSMPGQLKLQNGSYLSAQ